MKIIAETIKELELELKTLTTAVTVATDEYAL